MKNIKPKIGFLFYLVIFSHCGRPADPVNTLIRELDRYPEYTLILNDYRIDDGFFADYFLQFDALTVSSKRIDGVDSLVYSQGKTDWIQVSETIFSRYEHYVGMVVSSKSLDGSKTGTHQAFPPGYQYVGNSRYGSWGAGGFWQFYGQYALMSQLMGGWRVGRSDYDDYRNTRNRGGAYFGPKKDGRATFGTRGSQTEKSRPAFFKKHEQRRKAFSNRVSNRMGQARSGSSWGARTSRFGK